MKRRALVRHLTQHGCRLLRGAADHSICSGRTSTAPRHAAINDDLARKICKDLGIPPS